MKCEKCGIEIDDCESEISYNRCSYRLCEKHEVEIMKLIKEFVESEEKPKVIILDDNELSIAKYAEEYPENFKAISDGLSENNHSPSMKDSIKEVGENHCNDLANGDNVKDSVTRDLQVSNQCSSVVERPQEGAVGGPIPSIEDAKSEQNTESEAGE